jgi:hypothetical protein
VGRVPIKQSKGSAPACNSAGRKEKHPAQEGLVRFQRYPIYISLKNDVSMASKSLSKIPGKAPDIRTFTALYLEADLALRRKV